jgi:hypothetical protein
MWFRIENIKINLIQYKFLHDFFVIFINSLKIIFSFFREFFCSPTHTNFLDFYVKIIKVNIHNNLKFQKCL